MPDGTVGYTRDGSFRVDAQGQLVTLQWHADDAADHDPGQRHRRDDRRRRRGSAITHPGQSQPVTQVGQIQLATFVNPAGLDPRGQNLFFETAASGTADGRHGRAERYRGAASRAIVETSNVNVVEELVAMIQTQRAYEINSKAIQTSDQMLARLSQL